MAPTKKKRRSKHRGTAAGTIQARGRTGRPLTEAEKKKQRQEVAREERLTRPPTWMASVKRAGLASGLMFLVLLFIGAGKHGNRFVAAIVFGVLAFAIYVPAGYYLERFLWTRRRRRREGAPAAVKSDRRSR